jgi:hypothetical protein
MLQIGGRRLDGSGVTKDGNIEGGKAHQHPRNRQARRAVDYRTQARAIVARGADRWPRCLWRK